MGCMNQEVKRLESLIQQRPDVPSIPSVCNQSNAMERVIGPERISLMNKHPGLVTFSGSENPQKGEHNLAQLHHHFEVSGPSYPKNLIREAIVGSLHGNAYKRVRGLGPRAPVFKLAETLEKKIKAGPIQTSRCRSFTRSIQVPRKP